MNIQEENSARYFRVQSEREQTLVDIPLKKIPGLFHYSSTTSKDLVLNRNKTVKTSRSSVLNS